MSIYQEVILDHYRRPRNSGTIKNPTKSALVFNPLCGDRIKIDISIKNDRVSEIKFSGEGCAISQASASLLTEHSKSKKASDLINLNKEFMIKLVGIEPGPTRLKCLLLSLEALHKVLNGRPETKRPGKSIRTSPDR